MNTVLIKEIQDESERYDDRCGSLYNPLFVLRTIVEAELQSLTREEDAKEILTLLTRDLIRGNFERIVKLSGIILHSDSPECGGVFGDDGEGT